MPSYLAGTFEDADDDLSFAIVAMVDRTGHRRLVASMPRHQGPAWRKATNRPDPLALALIGHTRPESTLSGTLH